MSITDFLTGQAWPWVTPNVQQTYHQFLLLPCHLFWSGFGELLISFERERFKWQVSGGKLFDPSIKRSTFTLASKQKTEEAQEGTGGDSLHRQTCVVSPT